MFVTVFRIRICVISNVVDYKIELYNRGVVFVSRFGIESVYGCKYVFVIIYVLYFVLVRVSFAACEQLYELFSLLGVY